mgnify:CR=1 FL=1
MNKLQAILSVYGEKEKKKDMEISFKNENFNAWAIEGISKKQLQKKYTEEEILEIYYSAI